MSTGSSYATQHSAASRPIIALEATAQSYHPSTYASAAYDELASHRASPLALGIHGFARYGQREDRASILDIAIVSGAVVAALIGAGSLIVGVAYWFI